MEMLPRSTAPTPNLSRLITAAVINQPFAQLLLHDAEQALLTGYNGEAFLLDRHEKDLVLSIKANTLADFANSLSKGSFNSNPASYSPQ